MTSIVIPEGVYTMAGKKSIIKATAEIYRQASRKEKTDLLDDLVKNISSIGNTLLR